MASILQISGKDLGALPMKGFCPRCFWISRRARPPWQIFPGIFSSIDSYSKKVAHGQFDRRAAHTAMASCSCRAFSCSARYSE